MRTIHNVQLDAGSRCAHPGPGFMNTYSIVSYNFFRKHDLSSITFFPLCLFTSLLLLDVYRVYLDFFNNK